MLTLVRRLAGSALAAALVFMLPATANAAEPQDAPRPAAATAEGFQADNVPDLGLPSAPEGESFNVPAWSYHITSSCSGLEGPIRTGANYWGNATETSSSGTPVECTGGYVQGCGSGAVVGCNWGMGDRIMLSTLVNDFALLAAHEFGHNWYGHSGSGCADWSSPSAVMRTTMC